MILLCVKLFVLKSFGSHSGSEFSGMTANIMAKKVTATITPQTIYTKSLLDFLAEMLSEKNSFFTFDKGRGCNNIISVKMYSF
ncbi:hypothetical protein BpHYR1_013047 [Brachionus plicatilis]|uniref:Uncharacterized protein n=1 Tax=Brachionus plicatilis TaxID=10195 RepID=A0A3M7RYI1_BRAPC|nr:hypothetical protein BpHYR1_013047 [Brachionus plicatilis]